MKTSNVICMTTGDGDITYLGPDVRAGLSKCAKNDLMGATVSGVNANVGIDGSIEIDELILKTCDGRDISIGLDARSKPKITAEVFDQMRNKWRLMSVADDYIEDLKDLTTPPWKSEYDRTEDKI